jgi:hypothetical protein
VRSLASPVVDDADLLEKLVKFRRKSAAVIKPHAKAARDRYELYDASRGNPWIVLEQPAFDDARDAFHGEYKKATNPLQYIAQLREWSDGACPVCGATGNGTLDHYLPKGKYPEFSFYSKNLVPACFNCNTQRREKLRGLAADQRPIHPYFDALPEERMLRIEVLPPLEAPAFVALAVNVPAQLIEAVSWHIENVVVPAGLFKHCETLWAQLANAPGKFISATDDLERAREKMATLAAQANHLGKSVNTWSGAFFACISDSDVALQHLLDRI